MKTLVVKIPDALAAKIEAEARATGVSKSEVVRKRLESNGGEGGGPRPLTMWDVTRDTIEKLEGEKSALPRDFATRKKHYLREWGVGKKRHR